MGSITVALSFLLCAGKGCCDTDISSPFFLLYGRQLLRASRSWVHKKGFPCQKPPCWPQLAFWGFRKETVWLLGQWCPIFFYQLDYWHKSCKLAFSSFPCSVTVHHQDWCNLDQTKLVFWKFSFNVGTRYINPSSPFSGPPLRISYLMRAKRAACWERRGTPPLGCKTGAQILKVLTSTSAALWRSSLPCMEGRGSLLKGCRNRGQISRGPSLLL